MSRGLDVLKRARQQAISDLVRGGRIRTQQELVIGPPREGLSGHPGDHQP